MQDKGIYYLINPSLKSPDVDDSISTVLDWTTK